MVSTSINNNNNNKTTTQISFFSTGAADSSVLSSLTVDVLAKKHFSVDIAPKSSQTTCEGKPRAELQAAQNSLCKTRTIALLDILPVRGLFFQEKLHTWRSLYYVGLGSFSVLHSLSFSGFDLLTPLKSTLNV